MSALTPDECCEQKADRQYGVFRRSQAVACGLSDRSIEHRLTSGRWLKILTGVYCMRGTRLVWETMLMAVCLWAKGFVSHRAAALLWKMDGVNNKWLEVSSRFRRRPPQDVIVHRVGADCQTHTVRHRGFIVTDPTSTLIDLAGVLDARTLERALDSTLRQKRTYPALILSRLDEMGSRAQRHGYSEEAGGGASWWVGHRLSARDRSQELPRIAWFEASAAPVLGYRKQRRSSPTGLRMASRARRDRGG
jgi:hypothetical protein